eukprot:10527627-Lingulodinium_polyedra.AAC.1
MAARFGGPQHTGERRGDPPSPGPVGSADVAGGPRGKGSKGRQSPRGAGTAAVTPRGKGRSGTN